jgi:adenylate cyclase
MIQKLLRGVGLGAASAAVALLLWGFGWLHWWEARTWDWRAIALCKPGLATDSIRLVLLDQSSLDWGKEEENSQSWPWPRELYSPIIDFCTRGDAKVIAFDVLFTEPSGYGVEDDQVLGASVSKFPAFVGSLFLGTTTGATTWPEDVPVFRLPVKGLNEWSSHWKAAGIVVPYATFPIPEVARNATILGNVAANPDPDGVYRRVRLFQIFDGKFVPSGWHAFGPPFPMNPSRFIQNSSK